MRFTFDSSYILAFWDSTGLMKIDPFKKSVQKTFKNFFGDNNSSIVPLKAIGNKEGTEFIGLASTTFG